MKIVVDADASPVKDIVIAAAREAEIPVMLVMSFDHYTHDATQPGVESLYVDPGADAADYRIIQLVKPGDIIITQDYGLASLGLGKGCKVLHHKGFRFTNQNIGRLLESRHWSAKLRRAGQRMKGPKAFTEEDRQRFKALLLETIAIQ